MKRLILIASLMTMTATTTLANSVSISCIQTPTSRDFPTTIKIGDSARAAVSCAFHSDSNKEFAVWMSKAADTDDLKILSNTCVGEMHPGGSLGSCSMLLEYTGHKVGTYMVGFTQKYNNGETINSSEYREQTFWMFYKQIKVTE